MATQTFTETSPAVNRNTVLTDALTERRNHKLTEAGMPECRTPRAQIWWVVLVCREQDETSPTSAHWCFDEAQAEREAANYRSQGYFTYICASYAA